MNLGTGDRRKTITAVVLGVVALAACGYLYNELFATGGSTAPPAPAATTLASSAPRAATSAAQPAAGDSSQHAARAVTTSGALDPSLHMQAMLVSESVAYSGVGRNIFSAQSAPPLVKVPEPISSARPKPLPPCPPNCPPPPPPPPIALKFFGLESDEKGARQACLLHEDTVYLASAGDVVLRRYKVLSIGPRSIQVQDLQTNNTQTLPLLSN